MIPIEDDPCDVLAKAMRGLGISLEKLSQKSSLSARQISKALDGDISPTLLQKIAPHLDLSAKALIDLPSYHPNISIPNGLKMVVTPFGHAGVNAYILCKGSDAIVFDTGTNSAPILDYLTEKNLRPAAVVITHKHHDHTAGIKDFGDTPILLPEQTSHGSRYTYSDITITALDVSGHANPARAYFYEGLYTPVCIVGDAIFAGSMGGTKEPCGYELALHTVRENILSLPAETIIGTGHGPLTTIAKELINNPFLAK